MMLNIKAEKIRTELQTTLYSVLITDQTSLTLRVAFITNAMMQIVNQRGIMNQSRSFQIEYVFQVLQLHLTMLQRLITARQWLITKCST